MVVVEGGQQAARHNLDARPGNVPLYRLGRPVALSPIQNAWAKGVYPHTGLHFDHPVRNRSCRGGFDIHLTSNCKWKKNQDEEIKNAVLESMEQNVRSKWRRTKK